MTEVDLSKFTEKELEELTEPNWFAMCLSILDPKYSINKSLMKFALRANNKKTKIDKSPILSMFEYFWKDKLMYNDHNLSRPKLKIELFNYKMLLDYLNENHKDILLDFARYINKYVEDYEEGDK